MKILVGIFDGSTAHVRYEEIEYEFAATVHSLSLSLYKMIGCNAIEISSLGEYVVFMDKDGRKKDRPLETCIVYSDDEITKVFVGTIVISKKLPSSAEMTSLSPKDMQRINSFQMVQWYQRHILTNIIGFVRN